MAGAALALLGILLYANSLTGAFFFDDFSCIHENPQVRLLWPWGGTAASIKEIALAGRPVPTLLTAWNFAIGGQDPFTYHCFNLLVHLLNTLLLYGIIRRAADHHLKAKPSGRFGERFGFAVAGLWMAHPLVTEPVNYIIQRTELLMAFGLFATLYCLARAAIDNSRRWQAASAAACAFGMASKESMVAAPVLALLFDRVFFAASFAALWRARKRYYLALAATWLILAGLLIFEPRVTTAGFSVSGITPWSYFLTQSQVIFHYLRLSFWPVGLVLDYGDWQAVASWKAVWPYLAVLGIGLAWVIAQLRKATVFGFIGAWFFLTLAPTSSFLPILTEFAAERRMYLPLAAVIIAAALCLMKLLGAVFPLEKTRQKAALGLGLAVFLALSGLTVRRNRDYQSEAGMLRDIIRKRPLNSRAYYNLGIALGFQGEYSEAERQFRAALSLNPADGQAHNNLGVVLERQGRLEEALARYQEAIRLGVSRPETRANLERVRLKLNR